MQVAILVSTLTCPVAQAETSTIRLRSGASIEGEVLRKKSDRVIVDLGFMVLSVPADEVEAIEISPSPEEGEVETAGDIYWVDPTQDELTVKENLARCEESVVEIRTPVGLGSGFVIDPRGYVVTNDHVIAGEHKISITLFRKVDGELAKIRFNNVSIVATNGFSDLALLKVNDAGAGPLRSVPLGDSDGIRPGQPVFAVGSPLGFERSVSEGIVSLKNRPMAGRLFIQSTAQLNAGNSGGPLFNLRGEVVGINNLKIAAAGVEGLNFSIAANALKMFLKNRDAFAFDPRNPNAGFRYNQPPTAAIGPTSTPEAGHEGSR